MSEASEKKAAKAEAAQAEADKQAEKEVESAVAEPAVAELTVFPNPPESGRWTETETIAALRAIAEEQARVDGLPGNISPEDRAKEVAKLDRRRGLLRIFGHPGAFGGHNSVTL